MQMEGSVLFDGPLLEDSLASQRNEMQEAIANLEPDEALRVTEEELVRRFRSNYSVEPVQLDMRAAALEKPEETHLGDRHRRGIAAMRCECRIPFQGESKLFTHVRSGGSYRGMVQGRILDTDLGSALCMTWIVTEHERGQLKNEMDAAISEVHHQIAASNKVVESFNLELVDVAKASVSARREKVRKDTDFIATLGYPLRRHESVPPGIAVPLEQRTIEPVRKMPGVPGPLDPFLTERDYDAVLDVLMGMSVAMERSPRAFQNMGEEELRFVLLVPLNVVFKGTAAAEAFNYTGKTDILLLAEGRSVFVAECFVWDGPQSMLNKIEQLRGYATWRNTKLALIVFSRRGNFSSVLETIESMIPKAPGFMRRVEYAASSGLRCVISHRSDSDRELVLTVLAFDVPRDGS